MTALGQIKRLKQIKQQSLPPTCAPISEEPSHIRCNMIMLNAVQFTAPLPFHAAKENRLQGSVDGTVKAGKAA